LLILICDCLNSNYDFNTHMLSLKTETDVLRETADAIQQQRLALNLPQAELASRSGVPLGTLRRFEQTGQSSFLTVAKLVTTLGMSDQLLAGLKRPNETAPSIKAFIAANSGGSIRKRARRPNA
jgi:transcriptional regulator with XRE-family HTH domain